MQDPVSISSEEREWQRKKQEIINRVLAESIVSQLLDSGCDEGQVIDFATEVLERITNRNWGREAADVPDTDSRVILYSREGSDVPGREILRGDRIALIPLGEQHQSNLERWRGQPHIQGTCSYKLLSELIGAMPLDRHDRHDFIVQDRGDSPVGLVSLFHLHPVIRQAELAKLIGEPDALGAGYAHEATRLLLVHAFQMLDLQRVYLRTNGFNLHNIQLNERIGFRFEGILRASDVLNQELVDVVLMSMLGREFDRMYQVRDRSGTE